MNNIFGVHQIITAVSKRLCAINDPFQYPLLPLGKLGGIEGQGQHIAAGLVRGLPIPYGKRVIAARCSRCYQLGEQSPQCSFLAIPEYGNRPKQFGFLWEEVMHFACIVYAT